MLPQEQLDNDLLGANLSGKATESSLIFVCRNTDRQLLAKILCQLFLEAQRRLMITIVPVPEYAKSCVEIVLRKPLPPDQQPATLSWSSCPAVNPLSERFPGAEEYPAHKPARSDRASVSRNAGSSEWSMLSKIRGISFNPFGSQGGMIDTIT
jgi:hypothetical protein